MGEKICNITGRDCFGKSDMPLLFEISRRLNTWNNVEDALPEITQLITEFIDAERSVLTILNRELSEIYVEAGYGMSDHIKKKVRYKVGEGITGNVVQTGKPVYIPKIMEEKNFLNKTKSRLLTSDRRDISFISVPIYDSEEIVGTLSIYRVFKSEYKYAEDFRLLTTIGNLIAQAVRARQRRIEEVEKLKKQNEILQNQLHGRLRPENIIGNSGKMQEVYQLIHQVSGTNATVLIRGESGTGKELIADAIHYHSDRAKKPFIKVNCSALPETLIESELFGHEKGAFTSALDKKPGRFELAEGGTIFLDEIGDIPLSTQVKLLRTLQEKEYERVGGTKTIRSDVRIVAATNRNLEKMIEKGEFREDLYYRINVFPVYVPPLRERMNDIPILVDHFIEKSNRVNKTNIKRISTSAIDMLMIYNWPGNIRELENVIECASIVSSDQVIRAHNLPPTLQTADSSVTTKKGTLKDILEKLEKQIIIDTLTNTRGNMLQAAKKLQITERMMGTRVLKYDIDPKRFKLIRDASNSTNPDRF